MDTLRTLFKKDQNIIKKFKHGIISWEEYKKENSRLSKKFLDLLKKHGFPYMDKVSYEEYKAGIILTLHLPKKYLETIFTEIDKSSGKISQADKAYLIDKILVQKNQKQIYGTQYKIFSGKVKFMSTKDTKKLNKRRRSVKLNTIEEYENYILNIISGYSNF